MTISDKKRAANRANAAKSTGPQNPAIRRNNARFELLANAVVIEGESRQRFIQLLHSLHAEYGLESPSEQSLVDKLAIYQWLLLREWTLDSVAIAHEMRRQSESSPNESPVTRAMLATRKSGDNSRHTDQNSLDRRHHRTLVTLLRIKEQKNSPPNQSQIVENTESDPVLESHETH